MEQFLFRNVDRAVRAFSSFGGLRQFMTSCKLTETDLDEKAGMNFPSSHCRPCATG
jgi:hypothetical protein